MASVTYEHVTKKFGEVTAISDFNIDVNDKEFLVLKPHEKVALSYGDGLIAAEPA